VDDVGIFGGLKYFCPYFNFGAFAEYDYKCPSTNNLGYY
jgi:hypothetical protein